MSMNTFVCIKPSCDKKYESNEPEAYYCPECTKANKVIAAQVDAKIAARPKKNRTSAWQEYEKSQKMRAGGLQGVQIKI